MDSVCEIVAKRLDENRQKSIFFSQCIASFDGSRLEIKAKAMHTQCHRYFVIQVNDQPRMNPAIRMARHAVHQSMEVAANNATLIQKRSTAAQCSGVFTALESRVLEQM